MTPVEKLKAFKNLKEKQALKSEILIKTTPFKKELIKNKAYEKHGGNMTAYILELIDKDLLK